MPDSIRVLVVEDSPRDAELLVHTLEQGGYRVVHERVHTADAMREALASKPWDMILSDDAMQRFDALSSLHVLQESGQDIPFVIVSGTLGEDRAVQLMKAGASDYISKRHLARLIPVVARERADAEERRQRRAAEEALREREQQSLLELAAAYEATLEGWARALDLRDHETEGHSRRVTEVTLRLARAMGLDESACLHIRRGALLHDIGKLGVPDGILLKPGPLTADEWEVMRRHPSYARTFLEPIEFLKPALDIPSSHHERWDGSGYPQGLRGEAIPLAARIFAAADIWDALRSNRPYRKALPRLAARDHIAGLAGTHLDPAVVRTFLELLDAGELDHLDPGMTAPRKHILVVDDFNAQLLERWLTLDGHEVKSADSGSAALSALAEHRFDLVLLDVMIPEPNGLAVCRRIKEHPAMREVPVIVMSGLDASTIEPRARQVGADDFLSKPVDGYTLLSRVRAALGA